MPFTSTPLSVNHLERVCDGGWKTSNDLSKISGSLVFSTEDGAFLLDVKSFDSERIFPGTKYPTIAISSKGNALATVGWTMDGSNENQQLWVASRSKQASFLLPEFISSVGISFIDENKIFLRDDNGLDENYTGAGTTDKYYVFSLDTETFVSKSIFLPNFSLREHEFSTSNDNFDPPWVTYSPDLKYVAYPNKDSWDKNSILNMETGESVPFDWSLNYWETPHPIWQPDSKALTVLRTTFDSQNYNFYSIDLMGNVKQLTSLENLVTEFYHTVPSVNWSPDTRYLAFPIYLSNQVDTGTIFILDTYDGAILDLCYSEPWPQANGDYVWSQDSEHLATYFGGKIQIIDLENKIIYESKINFPVRLKAFPLRGWVNWEIP